MCFLASTLLDSSLVISPSAEPFLIFWVYSTSYEPLTPFWISFVFPAGRSLLYLTSTSNGISKCSLCLTSPVKSSSPTKITAFLGSLVVLYSDSSVTLELTIVIVLSFRPLSPVCWTPSTSAYFHSPFLSDESFLISVSNGIVSVSLYWPSVFAGPTFTILLTGALVLLGSPSLDSVTSPFLILWVTIVSSSPSSPFWTTSVVPGSSELSTIYSVSNSTALVFLVSKLPVKSLLPTLITASTGFVSTVVGSPTILEFLIFQIVTLSPSLPGVTSSYVPAFISGSYFTVYLNGIFSLCWCSPSVLEPTLTILFSGSVLSITFSSVDFCSPFTKCWINSFLIFPVLPAWSTFSVPASSSSSKITWVSYAISSLISFLNSPVYFFVPTTISCFALVTTVSLTDSIFPVSGLYLLVTTVLTVPGVKSPFLAIVTSIFWSYL